MSTSRPDGPHRKRVKHVHEPGDLHELTFSTYRRKPLLTNDRWRGYFCDALAEALPAAGWQLAAWVVMPEHVHLLVWPVEPTDADVPGLLRRTKRPCSLRIKDDLTAAGSRLLDDLTVRERPGRTAFRFWQEGPGYDRNLRTPAAVRAAIDYIHANPVRRGLVNRPTDWVWSSARAFAPDVPATADDPPLTPLPPHLWDG
ncbi:REP-associated tyrosine transposase [Alienimonas sp. DA493]|uniref:REP-associated tyrosine transposase n=1 Tax=Alienimonas sp. DA493 TaxID=3373605 RepID=UPI003754FF54